MPAAVRRRPDALSFAAYGMRLTESMESTPAGDDTVWDSFRATGPIETEVLRPRRSPTMDLCRLVGDAQCLGQFSVHP
jgi:hypothetical protein